MKVSSLQQKVSAIVCAAAMLAPATAIAGDPTPADVATASSAYSKAQMAELDGNFEVAADLYEAANTAAPSPEALRAATRARHQAGHLGSAATHAAQLLSLYPTDEESVAMATELLREIGPSLMHVSVRCDEPCVIGLDGSAISDLAKTEHLFYVPAGPHALDVAFANAGSVSQELTAEADTRTSLSFEKPKPEPEPQPKAYVEPEADPATSAAPAKQRPQLRQQPPTSDAGSEGKRRLSPGWFAAGASATVVLGAVAVWSGLDVLSKNDAYKADPTKAGFDEGRSAELRTNVLIGVTSALAVVSVGLAVMTRWPRGSARGAETAARPSVDFVAGRDGGLLVLRGSF